MLNSRRVNVIIIVLLYFLRASAWPTPSPIPSGGWSSVGNHRFRIDVTGGSQGSLVEAIVSWRRRDNLVSFSDTFIVSGVANDTIPLIQHCFRNDTSTSSTESTFIFSIDDISVKSYYLYYLPFTTCEYTNGACQYNADVSYNRRLHCSDTPWWPQDTPMLTPTAITYESVTEFDAYTDMERPMSASEFNVFLSNANPLLPLGALLIAEDAQNSIRLWGAGYEYSKDIIDHDHALLADPKPFCVWGCAANAFFLKTGGDPNKTQCWDQGVRDKCCSSDSSDCVWFQTEDECNQYDSSSCRQCLPGQVDLGCPSWQSGGSGSVPLPIKYLSTPVSKLSTISLSAIPNQNISFQAIVIGPVQDFINVDSVDVTNELPIGVTFSSFSTQGVDYWGRNFSNPIFVNGMLPLWLGFSIDRAALSGLFNISIFVSLSGPKGSNKLLLTVLLTILDVPPLLDGSDILPRIHWLNSRLALDDTSVPRPYTPIVTNDTSSLPSLFLLHGKIVEIGTNGLPASITTFGVSASPPIDNLGNTNILAVGGAYFAISVNGGTNLTFSLWKTLFFTGNGSMYSWMVSATDTTGIVSLSVSGSIDATGYLSLECTTQPGPLFSLESVSSTSTINFALVMPTRLDNAIYGMGLGILAGYFDHMFPSPAATSLRWSWDGVNGNNGLWVGSTTGGILFKLKGEDPLWSASVPYDNKSSPPPPSEWHNNGEGGIELLRDGSMIGFSGSFPFTNSTTFRSSLLITPVHQLNLTHHYSLRYAQCDGPRNYTFLAENGATVVNMHQGNIINPFINYPYLTNDQMNETSFEIHSLGMKFSIYNTMRELSNRCAETFAMRAMGDCYVPGGNAPGADWLREHVASNFLSAWSTPLPSDDGGETFVLDAAMRVVALSRWNNYYVEGVQQMMRDFEVDGIYLDEIAYDRITMMRIRKLLDTRNGVIDHHSDSGAFCDSPAMIYLEHFPFLAKLWYGEGFPYDTATPEYWLIEMSGLAFGLTAEMLRYPGETPYHFKGFLFGSSNRWQSGMDIDTITTDPFVPVSLWRLWQDVEIENASFFGWWLEDTNLGTTALPIRSSVHGDVIKVTTYVLESQAVVALASFASSTVGDLTVSLTYNISILGFDLTPDYCLSAPLLLPFQPVASKMPLNASFSVKQGQGWIFQLIKC
jgi:hypothetical protein